VGGLGWSEREGEADPLRDENRKEQATTEADPYGKATKRTDNGKDGSRSLRDENRREQATTEADPYGMTTKRTDNSKDRSKSLREDKQKDRRRQKHSDEEHKPY
jgi:hypothetical protein